ncbi:MAG: hypothetical protein KGL39_37545 [Patescibacteria group bacterium]|nr:hypothetical protein [Patescibacteria group bacterium]
MKPLWWMRGPLMEEADEGKGGGGGDQFDPVKFKADILAEFNKGLNGALKNLKTELTKKPEPEPEPEPEPKPGEKKPDAASAKVEKELAKLRAELDAERKTRTEAEGRAKAEKLTGALRTELLKYVPAERIDAALRIFGPDVKYTDEGNIVGGAEDSPLKDFIETTIKHHEYLLPAKSVGGAGASAGSRRVQPVDLNDLKPGMKADDLARVREEIARVASEAMRGQ